MVLLSLTMDELKTVASIISDYSTDTMVIQDIILDVLNKIYKVRNDRSGKKNVQLLIAHFTDKNNIPTLKKVYNKG